LRAFPPRFEIAGRLVGAGAPVLIIAEAGVSHFGDLEKALALVDMAAAAGADVFKTQAFSTERLVSSRMPEWRERLRPKEVSFDFVAAMKQRCDDHGLIFLCTAHDESVLPWLDELAVPAFKVGSGERGNTPCFREIARRGKPVILSTGMYAAEDVRQALDTFEEMGCRELALLHCVTSYPTPFEQVNLRAMDALRHMFSGPVGYSDHTSGFHAVLAAVARGAAIVEKHVTFDFNVPNAQDWKVSCGPSDFPQLVRQVRDIEAALGDGRKMPQPCEADALNWALKSLVVVRDLPPGTVLSSDMVAVKRPGGGITPARLEEVIGCRLRHYLSADEPIMEDDLER
jgi:N,N'-diacetyllegionaminate synthase